MSISATEKKDYISKLWERFMQRLVCKKVYGMERKVLLLLWNSEELMQIQYDNDEPEKMSQGGIKKRQHLLSSRWKEQQSLTIVDL